MTTVYMDHAATSPLRPEALAAMQEFWSRTPGNASSLHGSGRAARAALIRARRRIAEHLGAERDDLVFTGNGSEANVLALVGAVHALPSHRRHVLVSPIEHPCVLNALRHEDDQGTIECELLTVGSDGRINVDDVLSRVIAETGLVSVGLANHELGTIQPVAELRRRLDRSILLHTDAVQALGKIPVRVDELGVDLATFSAHKVGGPTGLGCVYRRPGVAMESPLSRDRQEHGLRGGTEDVASIVGWAAALDCAVAALPAEFERLSDMQASLRRTLQTMSSHIVIHSPTLHALPGLLNFSTTDLPGPHLLAVLDQHGIHASHGSACSSMAALPSPVLEAIGANDRAAFALRLSLGWSSNETDVPHFLDVLRTVLDTLAHRQRTTR